MAKLSALFCITLLLCYTLGFGSRPAPTLHGDQDQSVPDDVATENCAGVAEDECLMRRTLAAHIDYIYTQNRKP